MSIRIRKTIVFTISFFIALALYWPAMNGTPIWDDTTFWFSDPIMGPEMNYLTIWKNFAWPFSVSIQKLTLSLWKTNYFYYHLLCLFLHFANSLVVYKLGRVLRFKYPLFFFLLFLLHPVCVITTAWMVQIKTLLCFFFALTSLLCFLKGNKHIKWMMLSWVLFFLSLVSKSASITLPLIFLIISVKTYRFSKLHLLIPFFILSAWSGYKVLSSPVTTAGTEKAAKATSIKAEQPESKPAGPVVEKPKVVKTAPKKIPAPEAAPKPVPAPSPAPAPEAAPAKTETPHPAPKPINNESKTSFRFILPDVSLISQTMNYYFWQVLLPINNAPVKGLNYQKAGILEAVHLFFLVTLIFIFRKSSALIYLGAAHFLLIPFLGFMPAPYMNITWVSDQHLYLALPAMLAFWMRLIDHIKFKHAYLLPLCAVFLFSYKTYEATPIYKDEYAFYETSLQYNPYNVPIIFNLASARLMDGDWETAYNILNDAYHLSLEEPLMKKNHFYPGLINLYLKLKTTIDKYEN